MKNVPQIVFKTPVVLLIFALILSCSKTDPINLKAALLYDSKTEIAAEDSDIIVNLAVSEPLGKDLLIKATFKENPNYYNADENDYSKKLEYSSDFGQTWIKETQEGIVHFPKDNRSIKIKIPLKEDTEVEPIFEEIDLTLSKAPGQNDIKALSNPITFNLTIKDNSKIDRKNYNGKAMLVFYKSHPSNVKDFKLIYAEKFPEKDISFLYEKKHYQPYLENLIDFAEEFFDAINANVNIYTHLLIDSEGVGGYVKNPLEEQSSETLENNPNIDNNKPNTYWNFGFNARMAFSPIFSTEGKTPPDPSPTAFNSDGVAGYIFTHEMAHILSLHIGNHSDPTKDSESCDGFVEDYGLCIKKDSWFNKFYDKFYNPETRDSIQGKEFVTAYAGSMIAEDVAETVAYYVLQHQNLPELNENSSTALQKVHFVGQFEEVQLFAQHFGKMYLGRASRDEELKSRPAASSNYLANSPIINKIKGEAVSCRKAMLHLKKKRK